MSRTVAVQKRRVHTEQALVAAVGAVLATDGFGALGVNALAQRAGCDKALIYRYFGDLEGVIAAYGRTPEFWPTVDEVIGAESPAPPSSYDATVTFFRNYVTALRRRPATVEVLAWELSNRNALTVVLEEVREAWGESVFAEQRRRGVEIPPEAAMLIGSFVGAAHYFVIRARELRVFSGIDLGTDAGWETLYDTWGRAVSSLRATAP